MHALAGAGDLGDDLAVLAGLSVDIRLAAEVAIDHRHRRGEHGPQRIFVGVIHGGLPETVGLAAVFPAGGIEGIRLGSGFSVGGQGHHHAQQCGNQAAAHGGLLRVGCLV